MKHEVLCIFDSAANMFSRPMFTPSVGMGVRQFSDEVNRADKDNVMYSHPADFQLFHVGSFDDVLCRFELLDLPKRVAAGAEVAVKMN